MATHSSILAWRTPWTEEPGGLQSMGSQRVKHNWATNTHRGKSRGWFCVVEQESWSLRHWVSVSYKIQWSAAKGVATAWSFIVCATSFGPLLNYCCSAGQGCLNLCDPMDCSTPGFPVHHHLPELAHRVDFLNFIFHIGVVSSSCTCEFGDLSFIVVILNSGLWCGTVLKPVKPQHIDLVIIQVSSFPTCMVYLIHCSHCKSESSIILGYSDYFIFPG